MKRGFGLPFDSHMETTGIGDLRDSVVRWGQLWGVPELGSEVSLRLSTRFRRSLGTYRPSRSEITLAAWLMDGPAPLLDEVLCHESAHAAVFFMHGREARPHGREWQGLMARAEMPARLRIPTSELPDSRPVTPRANAVWEHRCPVCQATRFSKTRVTRWRCRSCRALGLSGKLLTRLMTGLAKRHGLGRR